MLLNTLFLALRSIRRNLLRSFLTILGIVIGVSAVITMVTLGNGATLAVQNQISSLGTNLLQVRPGQRMGPGGGGGSAFKEEDAAAIASQIGGIAAVAPEARTGATVVLAEHLGDVSIVHLRVAGVAELAAATLRHTAQLNLYRRVVAVLVAEGLLTVPAAVEDAS